MSKQIMKTLPKIPLEEAIEKMKTDSVPFRENGVVVFDKHRLVVVVKTHKEYFDDPMNSVYSVCVKSYVGQLKNDFYYDNVFQILGSDADSLKGAVMSNYANYNTMRRIYAVELFALRRSYIPVVEFKFLNASIFVVTSLEVSYPLIVRKKAMLVLVEDKSNYILCSRITAINNVSKELTLQDILKFYLSFVPAKVPAQYSKSSFEGLIKSSLSTVKDFKPVIGHFLCAKEKRVTFEYSFNIYDKYQIQGKTLVLNEEKVSIRSVSTLRDVITVFGTTDKGSYVNSLVAEKLFSNLQ